MKILETEAKNSRPHSDPSSITLDHYSFELDATEQNDYKLRLVPRHNSKYLLNGYALVKRPNAGIIRVEGTTSKRLSFWVGQADIMQEFSEYAGFWLPKKTRSSATIRLVGRTDLSIEAGEYHFESRPFSPIIKKKTLAEMQKDLLDNVRPAILSIWPSTDAPIQDFNLVLSSAGIASTSTIRHRKIGQIPIDMILGCLTSHLQRSVFRRC